MKKKFLAALLISAIITPRVTAFAEDGATLETVPIETQTELAGEENKTEELEVDKGPPATDDIVEDSEEPVDIEDNSGEETEEPEFKPNDGIDTIEDAEEPAEVEDTDEDVEEYTVTYQIADGQHDYGTLTVYEETGTEFFGSEAISNSGYMFVHWTKGEEVVCKDELFIPELRDGEYTAVFDVVEETEEGLVETKLEATTGGYTIRATGYMPKNAELHAKELTIVDSYEEILGETVDEKITVRYAFDIEIRVDGEVWQPVDDDKVVTIEIEGIEAENPDVHRIDGEEVTELESSIENDVLTFETEHFTVFTVGEKEYDLADGEQKWLLGDNVYGYWFEDDKLLFVTGTGKATYNFTTPSYATPYLFSEGTNGDPKYDINQIVIDEGIETIGNLTFWGAHANRVTLPSTLKSIGTNAFK